ncbi:hypothetical protein [Streptomyces neyagawaensis]|uniref:Uncharacterized protein n=1 Tax=Streptomyces neyagawaensis TaxID=42238 RepID=A0ABV3AV74_9ACTN
MTSGLTLAGLPDVALEAQLTDASLTRTPALPAVRLVLVGAPEATPRGPRRILSKRRGA